MASGLIKAISHNNHSPLNGAKGKNMAKKLGAPVRVEDGKLKKILLSQSDWDYLKEISGGSYGDGVRKLISIAKKSKDV